MTWRILHVEDEPDIREIVKMSLEMDPKLEVESVESGAAALASLAEATPDLILLDMMMPGMDGPTTFRAIAAMDLPAVPVVFVTARAQQDEIDRLIALGAAGVIAKPFDPMTLADAARAFLT